MDIVNMGGETEIEIDEDVLSHKIDRMLRAAKRTLREMDEQETPTMAFRRSSSLVHKLIGNMTAVFQPSRGPTLISRLNAASHEYREMVFGCRAYGGNHVEGADFKRFMCLTERQYRHCRGQSGDAVNQAVMNFVEASVFEHNLTGDSDPIGRDIAMELYQRISYALNEPWGQVVPFRKPGSNLAISLEVKS
jgi:hypothetical protein